jgi:tRNA(Ile)-lysidine synthase
MSVLKQALVEALHDVETLQGVESLQKEEISSQGRICIGLSAGVDSSALIHALAEHFAHTRQKLVAIHVHHGISANADAWVKQAQTFCQQLAQQFAVDIDCIVQRVELENSSSLEQAARAARYQIFEQVYQGNDVLLQGHHLDDQIETFFMRALRGSGLKGLAAIPKVRRLSRANRCQIIRPFLSLEKSQLIDYAQQHQLSWVEDESNLDSKIERNWWRNELLPQIWQRYPDNKASLARTLNNVQQEHQLLQALLAQKLVTPENMPSSLSSLSQLDISPLKTLKAADCISYLRAWFAQQVDILPSAIQMQSIYDDMILAKPDSEPSFAWLDKVLYRYQNVLFLLDQKLVEQIPLAYENWQGEDLEFSCGLLSCREVTSSVPVKFGLKPGCYQIRSWQPGDVAKPVGRSTRKMKKWWQDYRIPVWARKNWPLIVDKKTGSIVAVPGLFVCQDYLGQNQAWDCAWRFHLQSIEMT